MIPCLPDEWPVTVKRSLFWAARKYGSRFSGDLFTYPDNVQELALFYLTHGNALPENGRGLSYAFTGYLRDLVNRDKKIRVLEPPGELHSDSPHLRSRELRRLERYEMWRRIFTEGEDD